MAEPVETAETRALASHLWAGLAGETGLVERIDFIGAGALSSAFRVSDLAAASVGVAGLAVAELASCVDSAMPQVRVDRRLASFWFAWSLQPDGWTPPPVWDSVAGDYAAQDGWIRLHTNAPAHRRAALDVLGTPADRGAVAPAVARWRADDLEAQVVAAGGCAAVTRSVEAWAAHPQGRAVAKEPLIDHATVSESSSWTWRPSTERPLAGLKVLDLTRVLAGPVATRFLAGFGADVLRIDPLDWDEGMVVPEVTVGKRCARLDIKTTKGRRILERLLGEADVLMHGYRPGALDALGFDAGKRRSLRPGLIEVTLDAYGWSGPWAARRGFDSLVQMSAGIAERGMRWKGSDVPIPLPVQALDHATGYLMAAAAIRAVTRRFRGQGPSTSKLSLARTAWTLIGLPTIGASSEFASRSPADFAVAVEPTSWGPAHRMRPPIDLGDIEMRWNGPARALGSDGPAWA